MPRYPQKTILKSALLWSLWLHRFCKTNPSEPAVFPGSHGGRPLWRHLHDWSRLSSCTNKTSEEPGAQKSQNTALVHNLSKAKSLIIQNVQYEAFKEEIYCLRSSERLPKSSPLLKLSPVIDKEGFVRVGGWLEQAGLSYEERHPLILPSSHHVTTLLVTYYHGRVQHQGRHFTLGLIRSSGFWIIRGKRIVNSVINSCFKCKKLRGQQQIQKIYSKKWRQVQHLANVFWAQWRREFLPMLQPRRKWQQEVKNLQEGDLVLLCSKDLPRNCWPLARITRAHVSADGKVRKVQLVTAKDGPARTYTRPVNEVILLRTDRDFKKMETSVGWTVSAKC